MGQAKGLQCYLFLCAIQAPFWFTLQFRLTQVHEVDSEIINAAGRLRLYTQNIGVFLLATKCLHGDGSQSQLNEATDSFSMIRLIGQGLLGEKSIEDIPELLDTSVKVLLREWLERSSTVFEMRANLDTFTDGQMLTWIRDLHALTKAVDHIVVEATRFAQIRVQVLLLVQICRAVVALLWAFGSMYVIHRLRQLYRTSHAALQEIDAQQRSLLNATFDAVVTVNTKPPFEVLLPSMQLDNIVGQPMTGTSILDCITFSEDKQKLEAFLRKSASKQSPCFWCNWSSLLLPPKPQPVPVAPMLRTAFRGRQLDGSLLEREIEVAMVTTSSGRVLAVRLVPNEEAAYNVSLGDPVDGTSGRVLAVRLASNEEAALDVGFGDLVGRDDSTQASPDHTTNSFFYDGSLAINSA